MTTLELTPAPGVPPLATRVVAQSRMELRLLVRNGEQLLLTIVIPTLLLVVFATAPIADVPKPRVAFLAPGVLALAVMSTAFTGQAIATGFERRYGVLARLGSTTLPRSGLLAAKTAAVLVVEALQVALLVVVALVLGWHPHGSAAAVVGLLLLATVTFSALGLLMAGTLRAEATLAGANLVYLLFLVLGGVAFPLKDFGGAEHVLRALPLGALADGLRGALSTGGHVRSSDWIVLAVWTLLAVPLASWLFRWE